MWLVSCSSALCTLPIVGFVNSKSGSLSLLSKKKNKDDDGTDSCQSKGHSGSNRRGGDRREDGPQLRPEEEFEMGSVRRLPFRPQASCIHGNAFLKLTEINMSFG
jgi:hypothetical protein